MGSRRPGDSIGKRYLILDTLGQGGMGTVHLAKDRLGGLVALKRLGAPGEQSAWMEEALAQTGHGVAPRRLTEAAVPFAAAGGGGGVAGDGPTRVSSQPVVVAPESARTPAAAGVASTLLHVGRSPEQQELDGLPPSSRRAVDLAEVSSILLQTAELPDDDVADILRLTLAREFHLLASLRHPHIISVLDYGFDDDLSPYFTMELLQGAESIMTAAAGLPVDEKIDLLAQMLQALAYLHRRGVIHRDLKPGNVMVVGGRVKVLDFGVSTVRERRTEKGGFIVGTLAYMAPELLTGAPAGEASDLYAVGTIAYELFSGRHPFDLSDLYRLRDEILGSPPDLGLLDPRLGPVVGRLLEKRPEDRHESVDELFADLAARTGRPLSLETAATRESFLQAAELVGRDVELLQLAPALHEAMTGRGGGVLVGGESGVGKSRLLDELRARALVDGMAVLRGQAVSEGGGPYHLFREVLRGMVLRSELSDFEAGVLSAVVPDLAALLGREFPERAEIDPDAAHARLFSVVEELFRRHPAPVLIILEDLQWAGSESLRLLARLAALAADLPVLFLGSYRDDERADLPRELPQLRVLKLQRLGGEGIAALAVSMLGDAGRRPEVVSRLQRETEGNPFFLVEVVRSLAEDAGALSRVGIEPMPVTLPAGRLHLIVRRRLDQVPAAARPLLEAAAVIGRQVDPALLRRLDPEADLDAWIRTCANVAVLDFSEGAWRFAHDKLREGLLSALSPGARPDLHRRVAEAIVAEYGDAPEQTMALAHHFALACDAENEARYSALAGEQALQSSAYGAAVAFFERALAIVGARAGAAPAAGGAAPREGLRARVAAVVPLAPEPVPVGSDRFRLGLWEGRLSEAFGRMSNHAEAVRHGALALAHLGRPMPRSPAGLAASLPVQAALRGLMSLSPPRFLETSSDGRAVLLEATRIHARITESCFYTQEALLLLWSGLSILNLGEPAGPSPGLARGYALMAAVAGIVPLHSMARVWSHRALALVEQVGKPYDLAFVVQRVSTYRLWMGEWEVALAGLERVIDIARRVGDQRSLADALSGRLLGTLFRGRFVTAAERAEECVTWARRTSDVQLLGGALILKAGLAVRQGDPELAVALCGEVQADVDAASVSHEMIRCHGIMALAQVCAGDLAAARAAADRTLALLGTTRPVAYWTFDGIAAVAEAALSLWEQSGSPFDAARAHAACKAARAYASVFPIGLPAASLWEGLEADLAGHPGRARRAFQHTVTEAERLDMPYERARALLELGRRLRRGDPERPRLLRRAEAILGDLGAVRDRLRAGEEIRRG